LISTDVGAAREVIEHGVTGTLVPAADSEAIKRAVETAINDPERLAAMAEAGQKFVRNTFTVERMIDAQYRLYRKWLGLVD
jgi:glycosyltransferase involved in cell wall biosynthesis